MPTTQNNDFQKRLFTHNDYRREIVMRALEDGLPEDPYYHLEGKAVTFDEETVLFKFDGVEYKEVIARGAFDGADMRDVFLKFNHESSVMAAARTKNGTLALDVRADGVYIQAKLDKKVRAASELYEGVKAGLIDKMSFAFTIREESYDQKEHRWTVRKIEKLYDVAAVEVPAYENTSLYARRLGDVESRRAEVEALELKRKKDAAIQQVDHALTTGGK